MHALQIDASHTQKDINDKLKGGKRSLLHSTDKHPHFRGTDYKKTQEERRKEKVRLELSELGKSHNKLLAGWFTLDGRRDKVSTDRILVRRAFEQSLLIGGCRK